MFFELAGFVVFAGIFIAVILCWKIELYDNIRRCLSTLDHIREREAAIQAKAGNVCSQTPADNVASQSGSAASAQESPATHQP